MNVTQGQTKRSSPMSLMQPSLRVAAAIGFAVLMVLGLAWFDGGERPIRPITQPVSLPGPDDGSR